MDAGPRWRFLAGLPRALAGAVGAAELEAATRPPDGVVRRVEPDRVWMEGRWFPAPVPRVFLDLRPPVPVVDVYAAWGTTHPVAAPDGTDQPWSAGRWDVRLHLAATRADGVRQIEVAARPVPVALVDRADPAARALLEATAAFYPAWRGGWDPPPAATFVVVHAGGRPAAGAAIGCDPQGVASASHLCMDPDRLAGTAGSALLDALEAVALDLRCHRLCLDGSAFLHREHVPYLRHGYVVAPPYDGDADGSVWAEKELAAAS